MSARREDILNTFWDDEDVDALSNLSVLLYVWSFTNPRCGMAGIYACRQRAICEGRLSRRQLDAALEELADGRFLFRVDGWFWVRSRVRHLSGIGRNVARSIDRDLNNVPAGHPFIEAFWSEYRTYGPLVLGYSEAGLEIPHG